MQSNKFDSPAAEGTDASLNQISSEQKSANALAANIEQYGYGNDDSLTITDLMDIFFRRKWWMIVSFLLIVTLGIFYTVTRTKIYSSTSEIMVAQSGQGASNSDIPLLNDLALLTKSRSITTQVRILQSPDLLREAYESLSEELQENLISFSAVKNSTVITNMKDADIIVITVNSPDAVAAAAMANSIVTTYQNRDFESGRKATKTAARFIENELSKASEELNIARRALAEYKKKTGFYVLDATLVAKVEFAGRLDEELQLGKRELQEQKKVLQQIAISLNETDREIIARVDKSANPVRNEIESELESLEAKRIELLQTLLPNSPEIKSLDAQINAARRRLAENLALRLTGQQSTPNPVHQSLQQQYMTTVAHIDGAKVRLSALDQQLAAQKFELSQLPEQELQVTKLMSDVNQLSNMYSLLSDKYQTLRISEEARLTNVQVVTEAQPIFKPVKPRVSMNIAIFVLLGLVLSLSIAALLEVFDDRIHTTEALEKMSRRHVLAQIPLMPEGSINLINKGDAHSPLLEGFRLLRGNLRFAGLENAQHIIGVSSAGAGEGKSTTSINLGIALAMDGKRVLVVDCDLRKPSLHNYFSLSREVGFTDLLTKARAVAPETDTADDTAYITKVIQSTVVAGLSLLATGPLPPNPPEILNSNASRSLFAKLESMYDVVIVDMPPTTGFSDVPVLSTIIDALILVVSAEDTHRGQLQAALRALEQVNAPLLGFVYNKFSHLRSNSYYYYYYYGEGGTRQSTQHKRRRHRIFRGSSRSTDSTSENSQE